MRYLKTLVFVSLLSLGAASAAMAAGAGGISTGLSGSDAGMISEGGTAAFNLDAKVPVMAEVKEPHSTSRRGTDSYARSDAGGGTKVKVKTKKKKTHAGNWGFTSFGQSGYPRTRYRTLTDD